MRLAWLTDIHLNFLGTQQIEYWLRDLAAQELNALLITGDIGEAPSLQIYLLRMADTLQLPIYFVLGNHDYYHSSIKSVRALMRHLHNAHPLLNWLPRMKLQRLNQTTALIGHGGWGDGGYGHFLASPVVLNDYVMIDELSSINPDERLQRLRKLGQEAATHLQETLPDALHQFDHVYVAMHVPPFQESVWHEGNTPSDDDPYLPHFSCKAAGDTLLQIAQRFPNKRITVLCGHTHGSGQVTPRPNLTVITGGAQYSKPEIQRIWIF